MNPNFGPTHTSDYGGKVSHSSILPVWGENSSIETLTGFGKLSDLLNTQLRVVKPVIHDTVYVRTKEKSPLYYLRTVD